MHIILLIDFSGAKVWIVACSFIACEIDSRFAAVKISGALRLVMRSVLLGGAGLLRAGRSERSRERFGECRLFGPIDLGDEPVDVGGVGIIVIVPMGIDA